MSHLTEDGEFKSDKYDWCPVGFFALKFTDPIAQKAILLYAEEVGGDLAEDLKTAVANARA